MSELTPITRIESYLDAIVNSGTPPLEDITRIETFLQAIYDNQVCALTPITRIEMFLGKISGQDIVLPEPITRIELYLAAIAGEDVELPEEPITRIEMYLADWADSGDWTTISGAIVEFITQRAHKLKSCVVSLSPKQDLHGYDAPWPAGGGVNKFDGQIEQGALDPSTGEKTPNAERYRSTNFIGVKPSTRYRISVNGTATSANIYSYDANKTFLPNVERPYTNDFTTGADTYFIMFFGTNALNSDKVQIEEGSSVTAWTPYSNICPISGHTGVDVNVAGKNLFDWDTFYATAYKRRCSATIASDGTVTVTSTENGEAWVGIVQNVGETIPSGAFTTKAVKCQIFVCGTLGQNVIIYEIDLNGKILSGTTVSFSTPYTIANDDCVALGFRLQFGTMTSGQTVTGKFQLELGSTATDYEPYKGNSYSVTFGETVYGATPDLVSGEMPVTWGLVDLGQLTFFMDSSANIFSCKPPNMKVPTTYEERQQGIISSVYPVSRRVSISINMDDKAMLKFDGNIYIRDTTYADVESFKTAMSGVQLAYELATPIPTTITPTPITALKGYNAMWSDAGDIEVTAHGTPVEVPTLQALNMLLGGAYRNNQTADDVSDDEALDIILGGDNK